MKDIYESVLEGLLFKCDVRYLRHALRDLKDYIKGKK